MKKHLLLLAVLFVSWITSHGQSNASRLYVAEHYFEKQDYFLAAAEYKQAWDKVLKDKDDLFKAALAFYEANELTDAAKAFTLLKEYKSYQKISLSYLAKIKQHQSQFSQAVLLYKEYYKKLKRKDVNERSRVKNELRRCENGIHFARANKPALLEPAGEAINTPEDEYAPISSVNYPDRIYFSAIRPNNIGGKRDNAGLFDEQKGNFKSDIFYTSEKAKNSKDLQRFDPLLLSPKHDEILDFTNNGQAVILWRSLDFKVGQIVNDSFASLQKNSNHWDAPIYGEIGDHSLSVFQDSVYIFSSARLGGYGGYDLYLTAYRNGAWISPINLGPEVNTAFNEITPFIAKDGVTVYFSSNSLESIGSYDIFKTKFQAELGIWSKAVSVGMPINSAGDDRNFRLKDDGLTGLFSSDRKDLSKGKRDIFFAYFKEELEEQLDERSGSPVTMLLDNSISLYHSDEAIVNNNESFVQDKNYKDYTIENVFYKDDDFLNDPKSTKSLQQIVQLLQQHSDCKLQIISHSFDKGQNLINTYSSIKRAEQVSQYFIEQRIDPKRIQAIACGNSYPVINPDNKQILSTIADKWNKRIEFQVLCSDTSSAKIFYQSLNLPQGVVQEPNSNFRLIRNNVSYSIKIGESDKLFNHPLLSEKSQPITAYKNSNNQNYSYYYGLYSQFREVEIQFNKLKSLYNDIEIVPFYNGIKLERHEVIYKVLDYPDLILFINYSNQK